MGDPGVERSPDVTREVKHEPSQRAVGRAERRPDLDDARNLTSRHTAESIDV